jgi:hypothetical protein
MKQAVPMKLTREHTLCGWGLIKQSSALGYLCRIGKSEKPDALITNIRMVPPYPFPGQKVIFLASVKNQGSAASTSRTPVKVSFKVNGQQVSWSDSFNNSIPTGGMELICGNIGPDSTQEATIWNVTEIFGWVTTCQDLVQALE